MKRTIMLMGDNESRLSMLVDSLFNSGFDVLARFSTGENLLLRVEQTNPDIIVMELDKVEKRVLQQLLALNNLNPKPVVIFAEECDVPVIDSVVKAGVSAFVVDGLSMRRVKPIVELALARFEERLKMIQELEKTKSTLTERKIIDKAKGIIMKQRKVDEDVAYKSLREMAMNQNMRIPEVARNVVSVFELLA